MVLRHGRLVEWGGTRQIIKEPRQEYTNALVSVHEIEHSEQKPGVTPFLSVKNVTAAYGGGQVKVLKNVSVDIYAGQTLAWSANPAPASRRWRAPSPDFCRLSKAR